MLLTSCTTVVEKPAPYDDDYNETNRIGQESAFDMVEQTTTHASGNY